jgi:hypothetical protein
MTKRATPCAFCACRARFSFDELPMCQAHFQRLWLALGQPWHD